MIPQSPEMRKDNIQGKKSGLCMADLQMPQARVGSITIGNTWF